LACVPEFQHQPVETRNLSDTIREATGVDVGPFFEQWILKPGRKRKPEDEQDLLQRLIGMAQDRPMIAVGALIGAIFLAIRNPALTAVVVKAFLDPKPRPSKKA